MIVTALRSIADALEANEPRIAPVAPSEPPPMAITEAATQAGVSVSTLRRAVDAGEIETVAAGQGTRRTHHRITRAALAKWLAARTSAPRAHERVELREVEPSVTPRGMRRTGGAR